MNGQRVVEAVGDVVDQIRQQIFAGDAALEPHQKQKLLVTISQEIASTVRQDRFRSHPLLQSVWREILESLTSGEMVRDLATHLDPEVYFKFGEYCQQFFAGPEAAQDRMRRLVHAYLDLFRFPSFLRKIYDDPRWERLIHDLIQESNFTVSHLFRQRIKKYENKSLFKLIRGSSETDYSWKQVGELLESYAQALVHVYQNSPGPVAFLMENSLQMAILDLACLTTGIVNVMIPANSVPQHIAFILNQTKAPVLFLSNEKQLLKMKSLKDKIPHVRHFILMQGNTEVQWVTPFKDFISAGSEVNRKEVEHLRKRIRTDSLATIMYTSGTTGEPKGIMFSQMNLVYKRFCRAMALPEIGDHDRFLAYLPLYHTFGRWLELLGSVFWGATYVFMENPAVETMIANMRLVKPTIFISIPKKWIQLYEAIATQVDLEMEEEQVIQQIVRELTGGKLKWGLSAAGYLPTEIFQFFQKYGVELMSGFGMTEATGGITMTPPGGYRPNSLGRRLPGVDIKLEEDGELLIRGPYVMMGYYQHPREETFLKDGWFPTGDVMRRDPDGFIEIIDRKKEIYKNIKGETIAPQKIENYFRDFEYVNQVFLVGDRRPFNTVLIYPGDKIENTLFENLTETQKHEYFTSVIVTVNKFLAPFERIVDFRLVDRPFSAQHGELTPKGTFKRRAIEQNFAPIIEEMYSKNYIALSIQGLEVRLPNWFLREKGCLSGDVIALPATVSIPKLQTKLKIEKSKRRNHVFLIGDYYYEIKSSVLDLQILFTNPMYWLGNQGLFQFAGEGLFLWYRQDMEDNSVQFRGTPGSRLIDPSHREAMMAILNAGEQSLYGLHLAMIMLQSNRSAEAQLGLAYLRLIFQDETLLIYKLALKWLFRPHISDVLSVRRELFQLAVTKFKGQELQTVIQTYLFYNDDLLDDRSIHVVVGIDRGAGVIQAVENILQQELDRLKQSEELDLEQTSISALIELLSEYGIHHPTSAKRIRQILVRYQLQERWPGLRNLAERGCSRLWRGFRKWLGANQTVAVDVETGEEYGWDDVIITEEEMDREDRERIVQSISQTSILREAIFLFSDGTLIRLNDILPGGVWVCHLYNDEDKSVYRATVQTRFQGSFELTLNLNKTRSQQTILEEVNWLILAGSQHYFQELVEDFGSYWSRFDLWSAQYLPGDTVAKFLYREAKKKDETSRIRLYYLWPFFVWNAAASYCNFWKLTGYKLQLANPSPDNFVVPTHDYQTRTRVVSFSKREPFVSLVGFFQNFYRHFIQAVEVQHPFLTRKSIWNYIFSGVINAEGEDRGLEALHRFHRELQKSPGIADSQQVRKALEKFLHNVRENGFIPKQLFFAIKRFHRWYSLNRDASLSAQGQTLYDLYETYHLPELEKKYPETRTRFFLETAFSDSSEPLKQVLHHLVKQQHQKPMSKEEVLAILSHIQTGFELSKKEAFFLTRLSYPHLKPTDSAALVKTRSEGTQIANLVVQLEDYDGNVYSIRKPISPREISRLHQLFIDANLIVHFHTDHQFLVAISERGFIIGGLFYVLSGEDSVHMEKIVVADRYRRKGISEGLMNEFFNRMKSENIKYVTTGFFRPEYFYRFGFKIERKYSGLVKEL